MEIIKKILPLLFFASFLAGVIFFVEPPKDYVWHNASEFQILVSFLPLLGFLTFTANIFLNNLSKSFAAGLGMMVLVVLRTINQFNVLTVLLVVLITIFSIRIIPGSRARKLRKIPMIRLGRKKSQS